MTNSVKSTGGFLERSSSPFTIAQDSTIIIAVRVDAANPNGVYSPAFWTGHTSVGNEDTAVYLYPPDDSNGGGLSYETFGGASGLIVNPATAAGKWVHIAFVRNGSTTAVHIYALLEGFDPVSPSYLITPAVGNAPASFVQDTLGVWSDSSGGSNTGSGLYLAHYIAVQAELTEAQVLAQFAQRAPTAAVTAQTYTYLACSASASVGTDLGSTAADFTVTNSGSFSDQTTEPSDWATGGTTLDVTPDGVYASYPIAD